MKSAIIHVACSKTTKTCYVDALFSYQFWVTRMPRRGSKALSNLSRHPSFAHTCQINIYTLHTLICPLIFVTDLPHTGVGILTTPVSTCQNPTSAIISALCIISVERRNNLRLQHKCDKVRGNWLGRFPRDFRVRMKLKDYD